MFDFIYYNFPYIFFTVLIVIGALGTVINFGDFVRRREVRSAAARKGWATRRARSTQGQS